MKALSNRDLRLIFSTNAVGSFGDGLFAYILPVYMSDNLGASAVEIGILYAVMGLFAAFTLLVAGALADRFDRKKIMIAGWLAWLPAPLMFSLAQNWVQALPAMVMWGFWLGGPTTTAYIITSAPKTRITETFTTMSASWSTGYIFSSACGGYLAGTIGMRYVFYLSTVLYSVACLLLFFITSQYAIRHEASSSRNDYSFLSLLRTKRLALLSVFFSSLMFVLIMHRQFVPKFFQDAYAYRSLEIGVFGSVTFAGAAVLGILLGRFGDRSGKSRALAVSMVLGSASLVVFLFSGDFLVLVLASFLMGGSYIAWSLMSAIVGPLAPEECRARWIAIPQTASMFASVVAPIVGGLLYEVSAQLLFAVSIVALLLLAVVVAARLAQ